MINTYQHWCQHRPEDTWRCLKYLQIRSIWTVFHRFWTCPNRTPELCILLVLLVFFLFSRLRFLQHKFKVSQHSSIYLGTGKTQLNQHPSTNWKEDNTWIRDKKTRVSIWKHIPQDCRCQGPVNLHFLDPEARINIWQNETWSTEISRQRWSYCKLLQEASSPAEPLALQAL